MAADGKTALQRLRTSSPDMLIVDLKLPDLDGLEVLRQAKAWDEDLPVVILTANAKLHGAVEAMRAAAFDYLAKPYDHQKLVQVVRRALAETAIQPGPQTTRRSDQRQPGPHRESSAAPARAWGGLLPTSTALPNPTSAC